MSAGAVTIELVLPDERATVRLGEDLALALRPGDAVALSGDLGAGKTTLARGLIRALADDQTLEVPSPTFTLVQAYALRLPVQHFDLYRLSSPDELDELGLDEALADGAVLVEWPERAGGRLPPDAIRVELAHTLEGGRTARISATGQAAGRIARSLEIRQFLTGAGWGEAARTHLSGDASARSYDVVALPGQPARIVMNSPRLVLGPPVRDGKAYAEIAHTAQSVEAFVAIDRALAEGDVAVPAIHAQDLQRGFLLIEHLGSGSFLEGGEPVAARYAAAAELLAAIHTRPWARKLAAAGSAFHEVPLFDREALAIEADLLIDWYFPYVRGEPATEKLRAGYRAAWDQVFDRLDDKEKSLVLRDYHSPNIIWRGERQGLDRLGIIDFQDALYGPSAYDVASLAMDARVTIPAGIEAATVDAYIAARNAAGAFDEPGFRESYAITAAQRNSKILGIFVRLDRRDGKPAYLRHLPRIRAYLDRALAHPALADLRGFYAENGLIGEALA